MATFRQPGFSGVLAVELLLFNLTAIDIPVALASVTAAACPFHGNHPVFAMPDPRSPAAP
jgi:hypothetical protein